MLYLSPISNKLLKSKKKKIWKNGLFFQLNSVAFKDSDCKKCLG